MPTSTACSAFARASCACSRRSYDDPEVLKSTERLRGRCSRLWRKIAFLDASALIQSGAVFPASVLAGLDNDFGTSDASWRVAVASAAKFLPEIRLGRASLWHKIFSLAVTRQVVAATSHLLYVGAQVVSTCILIPGIQVALRGETSSIMSTALNFAAALFVSDLARILLGSLYQQEARRAALVMRHTLQAAVLLKAAEAGPGQAAPGGIVALLTSDVSSAFKFGEQAYLLLVLPVEFCGICAAFGAFVGLMAVPAIGFTVVIWGLQLWLSRFNAGLSSDLRRWQNRLLRLTRDVTRGIRAIKMVAWEADVLVHIREAREKHLRALWKLGWLSTSQLNLALFTAPMGCFLTVLVAVALGQTLPVSFIAMVQLFSSLRTILQQIADTLRARSAAVIAVGKVETFLVMDMPAGDSAGDACTTIRTAACPTDQRSDGDAQSPVSSHSILSEAEAAVLWGSRMVGTAPPLPHAACLVAVRLMTAKWSTPKRAEQRVVTGALRGGSTGFVLRDLSFTVHRGTVLGVTGRSGSGKSAIMSLILGDLVRVTGAAIVRGRIAYAAQATWLQPGSIRDNSAFMYGTMWLV